MKITETIIELILDAIQRGKKIEIPTTKIIIDGIEQDFTEINIFKK